MIKHNRLQESANTAMMFNIKCLVHLVEYALSNSSTSSYFLVKGPPAINIETAEYPIAIKLPDGSIILSTHTCDLDILWLPPEMAEAHIVPGL